MAKLIIRGGKKLRGVWPLSGNKNEALPLIAASLLFRRGLTLTNFPEIDDTKVMLAIAATLGVRVKKGKGSYQLLPGGKAVKDIPGELAGRVRSSLLFLAPLLALHGRARIPTTGGDKIGARKIDTHLEVFRAFGAKLRAGELVLPKKPSNRPVRLWLSEPSVTATENALVFAATRPHLTTIKNAASEPHVVGLGNALLAAGARIKGLGTNYLEITGTPEFRAVRHTIGEDYMEAGSVLVLSAIFGGNIAVRLQATDDYEKILAAFGKFGKKVRVKNGLTSIVTGGRVGDGSIQELSDDPWPSFPSDLMSVFVVLATQSRGQFLFHEKMFESRFYFTDQLRMLGAKLVLCDPHRVLVAGPTGLHGAQLVSPDIRAGMALIIAALAAQGTSVIQNIEQLDRGYENLMTKLETIGADVKRE